MSYQSELDALKKAHDAFAKAAEDFEKAVAPDSVILKNAAKNLISIARGIPRMVDHAASSQAANDARAAQPAQAAAPPAPAATPAPGARLGAVAPTLTAQDIPAKEGE